MINNTISVVRHSDSVIHQYVPIISQFLFPLRLLGNIEQSSMTCTHCLLKIDIQKGPTADTFYGDLVFPSVSALWIWKLFWSVNWTIMTTEVSWPYSSGHPFSELFGLCILSSRVAGHPCIILSLRRPCFMNYFQDPYRVPFQCWCPRWQTGSVCFWFLNSPTWTLQCHVPMIIIAIREPILRWYLLSSVLTYRGNYSSVFHCLWLSPQCPLYHLGKLTVLQAIPRKMFSWYISGLV